MKVDVNRLPGRAPDNKRGPDLKFMTAAAGLCLLSLMTMGALVLHGSIRAGENALAEEEYDVTEAVPRFTVQQLGDMQVLDMRESGSGMAVMVGDGMRPLAMENGQPILETKRRELFDMYSTDWNSVDSLEGMTGLLSDPGWELKEIRIGRILDSFDPSDFMVLAVEDPGKVHFTNNPGHPGLCTRQEGRFTPGPDGECTLCIRDGDVVRLIFTETAGWGYADAVLYDYDVTDGGYYLSDDMYHKGDQRSTPGQDREEGPVYVDAMEAGIHFSGNYSGNGQMLAFGAGSIGCVLEGAAVNQEGGVVQGLASAAPDGELTWNEGISAPSLFGSHDAAGKTAYLHGEYSLGLSCSGYARTLSSVESDWGTAAEWDGTVTDAFWAMDGSPSCGTDGHDPLWGSGRDVWHYRSGDRAAEAFPYERDAHDRFFGLSTALDFTLPAGYCGPLELFGYSDDDMFAFLAELDADGNPVPGTMAQVLDLGGMHGPMGYLSDLWDVVEKVPYGSSAKRYRLYVYWLERDGRHASIGLRAVLPGTAERAVKETCSIAVEACSADPGEDRAFVLDDGGHNRYHASWGEGHDLTVESGKPFMVPDGACLYIDGLRKGMEVTVSEAGRAAIWSSSGDVFEDKDSVDIRTDTGAKARFLSSDHAGSLALAADAESGSFAMELSMPFLPDAKLSVLDAGGTQAGALSLDKDGKALISLYGGQAVTVIGIPEGTEFTLEPSQTEGWRLEEAVLDGASAENGTVSGTVPAAVMLRYVLDR